MCCCNRDACIRCRWPLEAGEGVNAATHLQRVWPNVTLVVSYAVQRCGWSEPVIDTGSQARVRAACGQ